jgi:hypothetical protein
MKLKYTKSISESTVTVNLNLTSMTAREKKAVRVLGAPIVVLEKDYEVSGTSVALNNAVDNFMIETEFTGTIENISDVLDEANTYVNDVYEAVNEVMLELMTNYKQVERIVEEQSGEMEIRDGEQAE